MLCIVSWVLIFTHGSNWQVHRLSQRAAVHRHKEGQYSMWCMPASIVIVTCSCCSSCQRMACARAQTESCQHLAGRQNSKVHTLLSSWRIIQQWHHLRSTIQKTSNNLQTMTSSWFLMLQLALKTKRSCVSKLAKTWQVGRYWCCHMKRRWMRCFTSRCWRVAEDMGLSTFPWAEYFRRYEDYASKWGIAPVTGSDAWLYKSAPPIHWAFGLLWSGRSWCWLRCGTDRRSIP